MMELTFLSSLITFLAILLFLKLTKKFKSSKAVVTPKLPPGPWKLPIIGSLHHLAGSLPHRTLRDLARKHGPLMHLQLGEVSAVVISDARMAREVLKTHDISFASRPKLLSAELFTYNYQDIVLAPYGDYWRQMRKICVLELLSAKRVHSFCYIREGEMWRMIRSIQSSSMSPFNLTEKVFALANAVICKAAFGTRCKEQDRLITLIKEILVIASGFDIADLFPSKKFLHVISGSRQKIMNLYHEFDRILENIVHEHKEKLARTALGNGEPGEEDILDALLNISERGGLDFPISTNNIKAVIVDMFSAGTETTATTILWVMSEMIRNPGVMEKAQAEVRNLLKGKGKLHEKDLKELSYLRLVIKETLRLHPPGALLLPRECRKQCEINGYNIPLKTKVLVNAWAVNRDPAYWKDAENFEPERFLNTGIETIGMNYEYIPFGGGRRICPGISFGVATVELALAQLLYHFDWKLPGEEGPELLDMTETFGISVSKKNSLSVIAAPVVPFQI